MDGTQIATWTNIDSDTRRIDYAQLGPVANIDTGTRGTEFFDCFSSKRTTYIGPDGTALTPPPWPTKTDALFSDGFETNNFNNWTNAVTDSGSLSVTTAAAMKGTYGMNANINDNNAIYVSDWKPFNESTYRARFYFDPNTITMANGDAHYIFYAGNLDGTIVTRIEFYRTSSLYQVRAEVGNDSGGWSSGSWRTITDAPHYLEISWWAATAAGANNGGLTFWIDGVQQDTFTTVDNDTRRVDFAQLGAVANIDTGTRGTEFFDGFESRRTTYIGPMAALLPDDRLAVLPSWNDFLSWVDSVFTPDQVLAATLPVPTPDYNQGMAQSTPVAPAKSAKDTGIGHVLAVPIQLPLGDFVSAPLAGSVSRSITYSYDNLYRLTGATYNDGTSFAYTYDAAGNRLTEVTTGGLSVSYIYDNANRLTSVDGIPYSWDNNGNLLSDGTSTYTYDKANRLKTVVQGSTTYGNVYNGLGDRLRQTVNGVPTTYVLDPSSGLTQVLSDGSNTYLYGTSRIAEKQSGGWRYYAPDALGSVRQLVDNTGAVTLAKGYRPFGDPLTTAGTGSSMYGFTGEQRDASGLVNLRARYYSAAQGRFINIDPSRGERNPFSYSRANPINYSDPSGLFSQQVVMDTFSQGTSSNWTGFLDNVARYSSYAMAHPKWGLIAALLDAEPGDRLEAYSLAIGMDATNVGGAPQLRKLADVNLDYIEGQGLTQVSNVYLDILYGDRTRHGAFRGHDARYYFLYSRGGNVKGVYIDGSDRTDYPDFVYFSTGLVGELTRLLPKVINSKVGMCGFSVGEIVDRYGNTYTAYTGSLGPSVNLAAVGEGYVTNSFLDETSLKSTLQGISVGMSGSIVAGGGVSISPLSGQGITIYSTGIQAGVSFIDIAAVYFDKPRPGLGWNKFIELEMSPMATTRTELVSRSR